MEQSSSFIGSNSDSDAGRYSLYPGELEYQFGGEWHEIKNGACLVSSFSPADVITDLYNALEG